MSKARSKLDKWIANADDAEDLAEALTAWLEDDPGDDELEDMTLEIATRLLANDDSEGDDE
ncbi:hypothetical protein [Sinorhizobium fredii]|uniref:hypothetical protein n=1 Tax=Rhizobium fredii TaxID=380 RepID=UPI0004BAF779|nr:hypothetical protein [Sinorhizobium fredii]